ncbi:MAG: hypothetical protein H7A40_01670 [Chlamydiales bacterium]|nr:hypothetical protein [Chlamydiales bacterium]
MKKIDELDDTFSDVQLFLSQKISKLLRDNKSCEPWSYQLQSLLISSIKSEFQKRFPNRHLSGPVIQKVYEKVSYFYELIEQHQRLLTPNGTLDLDAIIRYHLKRSDRKPRSAMQVAMHIAFKVSEWIAIIEGRRCSLEHLQKRIWAAYKNICNPSANLQPCEIDEMDRWIIKHQISILSCEEIISERQLRNELYQTFNRLKDQPADTFSEDCTLIAAHLYSEAYQRAKAPTMTDLQQKAIRNFVGCQIRFSNITEVGRRLCSLYPLALKLPKSICEEKLKIAINYTYALACGRTLPACPILDTSIYALLNTQVIALIGQKPLPTLEDVTALLLELFACAKDLPVIEEASAILWHELIAQANPQLNQVLIPLVELSLADTLCNNPQISFDELLQQTIATLRADKHIVDTQNLSTHLRVWTIQGDMLHRWTCFNKEEQLYKIALETAQKYKYFDGKITDRDLSLVVADRYFESNPHMRPFEAPIKKRITAICKNAWYHYKSSEAPIQKLKAWHTRRLEALHPQLPKKEISQKLRATLRRIAPLCA